MNDHTSVVELKRDGALGVTVDVVEGRRSITVTAAAGAAAGKLEKGDGIVEVNGTGGDAKALSEALKAATGDVKLTVVKGLSLENCTADIEKLVKEKNCGPILIRLSWHDAGVYSTGKLTGGCPNAAMRFTEGGEGTFGANAGLPNVAVPLLKDIAEKYVPYLLSNADLWVLAANVSIRAMGGPDCPTRFGRTDATAHTESVESQAGRLPDGDKGIDHLREIFHPKGFNDRDIVALSGAHTVGKCHLDRSGFDGPWTENPLVFDNQYFKDLLEKTYAEEKTSKGCPQHRHAASGTMMLISDIALLTDPAFKAIVEEYAKDQAAFFKDFTQVWVKLQENGCASLVAGSGTAVEI